MGLAEKRAVQEFQDKVFPGLKKKIDAAVGFGVELEVQWDSLTEPDSAHLYAESFTKVYFEPLTASLKSICNDDMGKKALQQSLKKIVICNTGNFYNSNGFSFAKGILKMDHQPCSNIDNVEERTTDLTRILEEAL